MCQMIQPGQFDTEYFNCQPYSYYTSSSTTANNNCTGVFSYDQCMAAGGCEWKKSSDGTGVPVSTKMDVCFAAPKFTGDSAIEG